jgi:methylmalonyl-CoA mutase
MTGNKRQERDKLIKMEAGHQNTSHEVLSEIRKKTEDFMLHEGRRPRILATTIDNEQENNDLKVIASSYADFGFDVDINPASQTPELIARSAVESDVHVILLSTTPEHYHVILPLVIKELSKLGGEGIKLLVVGNMPPEKRQILLDMGVVDIIASGRKVEPDSADRLLDTLQDTH